MRGRRDHDHHVEGGRESELDEQRCDVDDDPVRGAIGIDLIPETPRDLGVHDRLQGLPSGPDRRRSAPRGRSGPGSPSGVTTSCPKASTTRSNPGVPFATASRASWSASITAAPRRSSSRATVDLPEPMPPVSPTRSTRGPLLGSALSALEVLEDRLQGDLFVGGRRLGLVGDASRVPQARGSASGAAHRARLRRRPRAPPPVLASACLAVRDLGLRPSGAACTSACVAGASACVASPPPRRRRALPAAPGRSGPAARPSACSGSGSTSISVGGGWPGRASPAASTG